MRGIERGEFDGLIVAAAEYLGQHFAGARAYDDAIAAPHRCARLHDDDVAGAIHGLHRVTGDFECIDAVFAQIREAHGFIGADWKAVFVEEEIGFAIAVVNDGALRGEP